VDVDALPIHAGKTQLEVHEFVVERVDDPLRPDRVPACGSLERRALGGAVALEQRQPFLRIPVRMRVDDAARRCAASCVTVLVGVEGAQFESSMRSAIVVAMPSRYASDDQQALVSCAEREL